VQTVREVCGGSASAKAQVASGAGRSPPRDVAALLVELLIAMVRDTRGAQCDRALS
jgi:hypothetical protein